MHFSFFQRACQQDSLVVESLVIPTFSTAHRGVFKLAKSLLGL